jgi:hypothetical protein
MPNGLMFLPGSDADGGLIFRDGSFGVDQLDHPELNLPYLVGLVY